MIDLYRGIPGAGKTFLAINSNASVCLSADDEFINENGEYVFDPARIGEAHATCFRRYLDALVVTAPTIAVHNTFLSAWEIAPYMLAASSYGREARIIDVVCDPEVAWERQTHGVPWSVFRRMVSTWQNEQLPPFWQIWRVPNNPPPISARQVR